jgi:tetratricopeptide (TPR) repeat protein
VRETQDPSLECISHFALGVAQLWLGQYRPAVRHFRRSAEVASAGSLESQTRTVVSVGFEPLAGHRAQTLTNAYAAWCLAELGDFQEAFEVGQHACRIAETGDFPYTRGSAYEFLGFVYLRQGQLEPAVRLLEQCLDLSRTADIPVLLVQLAMRLGYAYALSGRVNEAIALLEEGRDLGDSTRNWVWVPLTHAHLAEAYALAGRFEDAFRTGQHAIELAQQYKERSYEAWARYLLGNVHAWQRQPAADVQSARAAYLNALDIATELQMRPLVAQCRLALGCLPDDTDQGSRAHLDAATTMFREMGMQFWLEKAESALKNLVTR